MARLDPEAAARLRALLEKSDEELGRWLGDRLRPATEAIANKAAAYDLTVAGKNALLTSELGQLANVNYEVLSDSFLNAAIGERANRTEALANWLALRGDYLKAGRVLRQSLTPVYLRHLNEELRLLKSAMTKSRRADERMLRWHEVGSRIRQQERGVRMDDSALARGIKKHPSCAPDSFTSIRLAVPKLGLDAASWPETVKPRPRKKTNRKFSSRATLRK